MEEFYDQRNRTYELLNTPEARRRAADIDQKYGTEYNKVYDKLTKEYEDITSKALQDYRYLRNPTEKKSIMNQFDEYLMNNYTPSTYPQTTKEFKEAIEKAPDIHRNMKLLLKIHNKPSILFKDFKNRPLVNNTTKDKNKELV